MFAKRTRETHRTEVMLEKSTEESSEDPRRTQKYIDYTAGMLGPDAPKLSARRQKAITELTMARRCRSAGHALFLHQAGVLSLPS